MAQAGSDDLEPDNGLLSAVPETLETSALPSSVTSDLQYGYIRYRPGDPPNPFFAALVAAHAQAGGPQALVLAFIDGQAPYEGEFLARPGEPPGLVGDFPGVAHALRRAATEPKTWLKAVQDALNALLAGHGQSPEYFASPGYHATVDRIWQSYFALIALYGFDEALSARLALSLWLAHVVDLAVAPTAANATEVTAKDLSPQQISLLTRASIVLPAEIFPLPPPSAT